MKTGHLLFTSLLLALLLFSGCSPALNVRLAPDNEISMQFVSGTGDELSKTFTALTGQQMGMIDTSSARKAMLEAGLSPSTITQSGPDFWLSTGPDSINGILSGCPGTISVQSATPTRNSGTAGSEALSFILSPETAQYIISLLPEETASYSELFMAPIFTGEIMSADEYTDLIAAVYGQQLADELASASFRLTMLVPGSITAVSGPEKLNATTIISEDSALINIPLSSLLTLSDAHSILVFFDKTKYTN